MRSAKVTVHLGHLLWNYQRLCQQAGQSALMAVIKANAYGHGLSTVGKALAQAGCDSFAVTDAQEGVALRADVGEPAKIILLAGIFDQHDAFLCQKYALTPVLSELKQLAWLAEAGFTQAIWLKVDTGMQRIGVADLADFMHQLEREHLPLAGIMSHLACADEPNHPFNQQQTQRFQALQKQYQAPAFSLLNSAGLVAFSHIQTDIVRPGLALYGAEPIPDQPLGLKPVMQLSATISQIRPIQAGESVSYGGTWSAPHATHIAVVSMGYADGLPRLLSNQGEVMHHSGRLPIVGRVCMDYCMLAVDAAVVNVGDEVVFFGFAEGAPLANDVASQCQTIAYELFTSIGGRVLRHDIEDEG